MFVSVAFAEDQLTEKTTQKKNLIKQAASEETQSAEDELLKLEKTVGESADPSETHAAKNEASAKLWLPAAKKFDWADVKYLKSYRPSNINVENHEPVNGSLQISGDKVTITDGDNVQEFDRLALISLTPSGDREVDLWAIKFTLGFNI